MRPDALATADVTGGLEHRLGTGCLPPPRYDLHVALRDGTQIDDWAVVSFTLDERLHAPYVLTVLALVPTAEIDLEGLLGARVTFALARGERRRAVHGIVLEAELVDGHDEAAVRLQVAPALALLDASRRCRVFQRTSTPELAKALLGPVLAEHGGTLRIDRLARSHEPRELRVQHRETDLQLLLRALADDGITLLFEQGAGAEAVVLVDDDVALPIAGHEPLEDGAGPPPVVPVMVERVDEIPVESIQTIGRRCRLGQPRCIYATSNSTILRAGSVFELLASPHDERGDAWVVTAIRHHGDAAPSGASGSTRAAPRYGNELQCRPLQQPAVPPPERIIVAADHDDSSHEGTPSHEEPIVLRCGDSRLELRPNEIVLQGPRVVAKGPLASLVLDGDAITLLANKKVELAADVLAAVSSSITVLKGPTCMIGGMNVDIEAHRITLEAGSRIDISTPGEVDIRGTEMVKLNC